MKTNIIKSNLLSKKGRQCPFKSLVTHCDQETAKILSNYYNHLLYERNYSINTINGYFYDIKMLVQQVSQNFQHNHNIQDTTRHTIQNNTQNNIINRHFLNELNPNHIRTFLFSSNLHKNSMKRFFSSIRSLISYLISQKFIDKNEILNMEQGKGEQKLPHPMNYENIMEIIHASTNTSTNTNTETSITSKNNSQSNNNKNHYELLYSTIFTTIYGMGLRISELINLTVHDFIMMKIEKKIKILGKGQKERIIPVIRAVENSITQYMRNEFAIFLHYKNDVELLNFLQNNIPKNEPIFTIHRVGMMNDVDTSHMGSLPSTKFSLYSQETSISIPAPIQSTKTNANAKNNSTPDANVSSLVSRKISPSTIQKNMKRILKNLNINNKFTPHSLRHSFASHMIENGAELRYIQELLGHSSAKSTQTYTQINTKVLIEHIQNIHPRNKTMSKNAYNDGEDDQNNNQNSKDNK